MMTCILFIILDAVSLSYTADNIDIGIQNPPNLPAHQYRTATWNMQGSRGFLSSESKWARLARTLLEAHSNGNGLHVVSVQECGELPELARINDHHMLPEVLVLQPDVLADPLRQEMFLHVGALDNNIVQYTWTIGNTRQNQMTYYIYQWQVTDPISMMGRLTNQFNMAVLSRYRAQEIIIYSDISLRRPIFGIRLNTAYFFSIHAPAYDENPSAEMVDELEQHMRQMPGHPSWIIMGDFNRDLVQDELMENDLERHIIQIPNRAPTHRDGGVLDYAVLGSNVELPNPSMSATYLIDEQGNILLSDHAAVRFWPE